TCSFPTAAPVGLIPLTAASRSCPLAANPGMLLAAHRPRPRNFHNATHRVVELVLAHGIGTESLFWAIACDGDRMDTPCAAAGQIAFWMWRRWDPTDDTLRT